MNPAAAWPALETWGKTLFPLRKKAEVADNNFPAGPHDNENRPPSRPSTAFGGPSSYMTEVGLTSEGCNRFSRGKSGHSRKLSNISSSYSILEMQVAPRHRMCRHCLNQPNKKELALRCGITTPRKEDDHVSSQHREGGKMTFVLSRTILRVCMNLRSKQNPTKTPTKTDGCINS